MNKIWLRALMLISAVAFMASGCATRYEGEGQATGQTPTASAQPEQTPSPEPTPEPGPAEGAVSGKAGGGELPQPSARQDAEQIRLGGGLHKYKMQLELDEQGKLLTGHLSVEYKNQTGEQLDTVPFHLYPNTYLEEGTAPFFQDEMYEAYPNGFSEGGIEVTSIKAGGAAATHTLENDDSTLMQVALPQPLPADDTLLLEMDFTVTIPNSLGRFGYGEKTINLCNFYPIACAWNGQEFYTYPYHSSGDPFVSDVSDYEVELNVPEGMVVAHTGNGTEQTAEGITTYTISAPMVRDFAAVASREFEVASKKVGNTTVRSYYYKDEKPAGITALNSGADAISVFSKAFGLYPYDDYAVVQTDFFIGGMEYPGLVLIDESSYDMDMMLEYVVVHETAHQWWYGVVGNDQVMEPWIDEALAEYSSMLYYGENYDDAQEQLMYKAMVLDQGTLLEAMYGEQTKGVGEPAKNFDSLNVYSYCIYNKGNQMYHEIEQRIGRPMMKKVLSTYFKENMYGRTTRDTVINTFNRVCTDDVTDIFEKWL